MAKILVANKPVVDLRKTPIERVGSGEDPNQETQLLYGETVLGYKEENGWIYVHAPMQPFCKGDEWTGYPGWVKKDDLVEVDATLDDDIVVSAHGINLKGTELVLSIGTSFEVESEEEEDFVVRLADGNFGRIDKNYCKVTHEIESVVKWAETFIGMPYFWGGKSSFMGDGTSVDCSGLAYLCYSLNGIIIPRNAHDQYLRALKLDRDDLEEGDLVFTSKLDKPERVTHVMVYAGDGEVIEASSKTGTVRRARLKECSEGRAVSYGRYVKENFLD